MRVAHPLADEDGVALAERGEKNRVARGLRVVFGVVIGQVFVGLAVALFGDRGSTRGELAVRLPRGSFQLQADRHTGGVGHLRGESALPDQPIEGHFLLRLQLAFDLLGRAQRQRGSDGFVRLLRILHFRAEHAGLRREHVVAVHLADGVTHLAHRLGGKNHRVGTHVGDEAVLVKALGDAHHLSARQAQFPAGFLLESARHEGCLGRRTVGLVLDADDRERLAGERGDQFVRTRFGDDDDVGSRVAPLVEVLAGGNALAIECGETCREGRRRRGFGIDVEVSGGTEGDAFAFTFDDET